MIPSEGQRVAAIFREAEGDVIRLRPGKEIFREGDPFRNGYYVVSGPVIEYYYLRDGRRVISHIAHNGFIGEQDSKSRSHSVTAQALGPAEILVADWDKLKRVSGSQDILVDSLLARTAAQQVLNEVMRRDDGRSRTAHAVLDFYGRGFTGAISQDILADRVGLSRQTFSSTLSELRRGGKGIDYMVTRNGKKKASSPIFITDRARLQRIALGRG
jgi:CRP-like cAMP-binding protein